MSAQFEVNTMAKGNNFNYRLRFQGVDNLTTPLGTIKKSMAETSQSLRRLKKLEHTFGEFKALRRTSHKTRETLKQARQETARLGRAIAQTDKPTAKMTAAFKKAKAATQALKKQQAQEISKLAKLGQTLKTAGYDTKKFSGDQHRLKAEVANTNRTLEDQRAKFHRLTTAYKKQNAAQRHYQKSLQAASNMGVIGASGVAVGTRTMRSTFGLVTGVRAQEAAIGRLKSLGQSSKDIETKLSVFQKIADRYAYIETPDLVSADYDVVSALSGLKAESQAYITGYSSVLARATNAQAGEMTDLATTAYGMFKGQSPGMTDINWMDSFAASMAASVKAFKTTGPKMQQAFKSAGPVAADMGFTMEEYAAILGAGQKTMDPGPIGTAFESYAAGLNKAQAFFTKQGLNIRLLDQNNKRADIGDVIADLTAAFGEDWDAKELGMIKDAFGQKEAAKFLSAMRQVDGDRRAGLEQIRAFQKQGMGSVGAMATAMDQNGDAQIQKAIEDWRSMKRELGYALLPVFTSLIPVLKSASHQISQFVHKHKRLVAAVGVAVIVFAALTTVMGGITIALASMIGPFAILRLARHGKEALLLTKALKLLGRGFIWLGRAALPPLIAGVRAFGLALMTTPLGWMIGGLALLAGAAFLIIKYWKPLSGFFAKSWAKLKPILRWTPIGLFVRGFGTAFKYLVKLLGGPQRAAQRTWAGLKAIFSWSPIGLFLRGWKRVPGEFKSIFDLIVALAIVAMKKVTNAVLGPIKQLGRLKDKLGFNKVSAARAMMATPIGIGIMGSLSTVSAKPVKPLGPLMAPPATIQNTKDIVINVQGAPGMDERRLAQIVADKLSEAERRQARRANGQLRDIEE